MMHGMADELSKGDLSDEEQAEIEDAWREHQRYVNTYRKQKGQLVNKPLLNGNEIRDILFSEVPEMVESNAFIAVKDEPKPLHFIAYVMKYMLAQQWMGRINTKEEAEEYVRKYSRDWRNLWKKRQQQINSGTS